MVTSRITAPIVRKLAATIRMRILACRPPLPNFSGGDEGGKRAVIPKKVIGIVQRKVVQQDPKMTRSWIVAAC